MTESGSIPIPASSRPVGYEKSTSRPEPNARPVHLPADLRDLAQTVRLRGEVVRQNEDGSVRIRTPRGDIDIRMDKNETPPRTGQQVEIEIPPGRPPETVTVRPVPPAKPEASAPAEEYIQTPAENTPRTVTTPVNIDLGTQKIKPQTFEAPVILPSQTLSVLPPAGSTIRLQPVSPQDIIAFKTTEILASAPVQTVLSASQAITLEAQNAVSSPILNVSVNFVDLAQKPVILQQEFSSAPPPAPVDENIANQPSLPFIPSTTETNIKILPVSPQAVFTNIQIMPAENQADVMMTAIAPSPDVTSLPALLSATSLMASIVPDNLLSKPDLPATGNIMPNQASFDARIESIRLAEPMLGLPKQSPQETVPAPQSIRAGALEAVIAGTTQDQRPVLEIFFPGLPEPQSFALPFPVENVIAGTRLELMPQASTDFANSLLNPTMFTPAQFMLPDLWPVLNELYQTLAQIQPQLAQNLSTLVLSPSNPGQITPAALFFIAAVRAGDLSGWLGDKTIEALRRDGRGNLLSRITQEGGLLSRLAAEPVSQDWRGLSLPIFWDNQLHKIALHYKQDSENEKDENRGNKQTRFLFDLALPKMGKVQLDGLFRLPRLDLIVRTESSFNQASQMEMRRLYAKALGQSTLSGELTFQNQPEQWVTIQASRENFEATA